MNIQKAKEYIKQTVEMYLKKDEFGDYRIPVVRQRPIFLVGAPGIGKSAIMEQIAGELGIALVSYSMTHHTRQSALGLPFIKEKDYDGLKVDVSEYTMSEIIASIYETIKESGIKEGILFLDEINCVSETLYPSMLQFLQFKVFGRHSVPEGWVVVTAGNPPQYNRSVKEFDVVTLDRLKVIEVHEDYEIWKKYAQDKNIHNSILGYLDGDRESFYHIETSALGTDYVTARGWEDLSDIIYMYEESGQKVDEELISQYLRSDRIIREFAAYYELYNKYRKTFEAGRILLEGADEESIAKIASAPFDEKIALVGILLDNIKNEVMSTIELSDMIKSIRPAMAKIKEEENAYEEITKQIEAANKVIKVRQIAGTLTPQVRRAQKRIIAFYEMLIEEGKTTPEKAIAAYNAKIDELKGDVTAKRSMINNAFEFVEKAFGESSNEMLIFVTNLTASSVCASFLANYGAALYDKYKDVVAVNDVTDDLRGKIEKIISDK